jgi:hypothetical protein
VLNRWNGGAHLGGGNGGGGSLKFGEGNGGLTSGSDRRSTGERWGAVRAFCERIVVWGKRDGGDDWWPTKGARQTASWRRNRRGWAARSHHTEEKGGPDRCSAVAGSTPKPVDASGIWTGEAVRGPLTRGRRPQCRVLNPSTGSNHLTEFDFKF